MTQYQPQGFNMLPPAVKHLIIINALLYGVHYVLGMRGINLLPVALTLGMPFSPNSFVSLNDILGMWSLDTHGFGIWQPFTYMFMHGSFMHLLTNMFMLWMFGNTMENIWGTRRFIIYYLLCGLGAGLITIFIPGAHTVGASGAVYGLLLAFGMTFPNEYIYLYFLMPIKAKWMIIGMVALELFEGVFLTYDGIAHFAHLGGMLVGLLLILYWRRHPFSKF
jgi:membrane associated rhomboid family serine protease